MRFTETHTVYYILLQDSFPYLVTAFDPLFCPRQWLKRKWWGEKNRPSAHVILYRWTSSALFWNVLLPPCRPSCLLVACFLISCSFNCWNFLLVVTSTFISPIIFSNFCFGVSAAPSFDATLVVLSVGAVGSSSVAESTLLVLKSFCVLLNNTENLKKDKEFINRLQDWIS